MRKTAYEMRMSDWSSDVCSSDLTSLSLFGRSGQPLGSYSVRVTGAEREIAAQFRREPGLEAIDVDRMGEKLVLRGSIPDQDTRQRATAIAKAYAGDRSEEHTSELQSLMRISYAVFCLKKKKQQTRITV